MNSNPYLPYLDGTPDIRECWVPDVRRIAVLRANAIGDFILSIPALQALKSTYPQAELVFYGLNWHAEFLAGGRGLVDRVIVIPPMRGLHFDPNIIEDPGVIEAFFAKQRRENFDLALQMHGGGKYSNPFVRRLRARLTAGTRTPDSEPLDRMIPYVFYHLEWLRWLEVVGLVGAPPLAREPRLQLTPEDHTAALEALPSGSRPVVALHPGAGDPRRRWPPEKFAAVGDSLAEMGAQVVITGAYGDEAEASYKTVDAMQSQVVNLFGKLSLGGTAALYARCRLVVSNDSGPLHLARAVGACTVGIYWCGNMINWGPLTTARHRTAISWRLQCPRCGENFIQQRCEHSDSWVAEVEVDEVLGLAKELYPKEETIPALSGRQPAAEERNHNG